MDSGQDPAPLEIENPSENFYPIKVNIVCNSNAQSIYSSPVIQPGEHLDSAILNKILEPGEYPCSVTFTTLSKDAEQSIAKASCFITIQVSS